MFHEYLEKILAPIALKYDNEICEKGAVIETILGNQANLLDELESLFFHRSIELVDKAFDVGLEIGMVLGQNLPGEDQEED